MLSLIQCRSRLRLAVVILWVCLNGAAVHAAESSPLLSTPPTEQFPPVELRGYGTISGSFWKLPDGSVLQIDCDGPDTAKLTHAKFLSDLQVLPGVSKSAVDGADVYEVEQQGLVRASVAGRSVVILTSPTKSALQALVQNVHPGDTTAAQTTVPMWLDRWDKFNFKHYYIAWATPKGVKSTDYDYIGDFKYAQQQDRAGLLIAMNRLPTDTADEMLNTGWNGYEFDEALKYNLPVDLHLGFTDTLWSINRYRDQMQLKMPGFTGNFHSLMSPYLGGMGFMSWDSTTGQDDALGLLQTEVRKFANQPNTVSYLEPHGETHHGAQDILLEYGPYADAAYRRYMQTTYHSIETVARRWNRPLKSWDDIRVPELSSFAGDGPNAIDVGGIWRIRYEELKEPPKDRYSYDGRLGLRSAPAPEEWFKPDFNDSGWPQLPGAGNDKEMFLEKRPAVFRRTFNVPTDYKSRNSRLWLYLWDMNLAAHAQVRTVLNGEEVGNNEIVFNMPHWQAMDVSKAIRAGKNTLAIRLPQGYIAYKTYLSPVEPHEYPDLGEALNAQWVDFLDFTQWSRVEGIRRGMEMIRQVSPGPGITLMHPDEYSDGIKAMAVAYGGEFHNTGYMGGFYADYNTMLMRGANLPYSIEPGAPAHTYEEWKNQWGLYQTEGVQAVDYFIHLGDILWNPDFKADYEAHRKQITLMGQSHFPKAELALLMSDRVSQLTTFPWKSDPNSNLGAGYWKWNASSVLRGEVPYDGLSQSSFDNGEADPYKLVIDTNTSIMDPALVTSIEKWVRNGGTFVTLGQTGRHTPEKTDSWPIEALTGYHVTKIDHLKDGGGVDEHASLKPAPNQNLYGQEWNGVDANGLHLKKAVPDVQDLLLWPDGTAAAGMRKLGKGYVIELGAKFSGYDIPDRIGPTDFNQSAKSLHNLLMAIIKWRQLSLEPGQLITENRNILLRHNVTNNGLFDTWTLWNQSKSDSQTVSVKLTLPTAPTFAIDMVGTKKIIVHDSILNNIALQPLETRVFLTPRQDLAQAPLKWFDLQQKWWRGTTKPPATPLPQPKPILARDLTDDWKFKPLDAAADARQFASGNVNGGDWQTREMGVWDTKAVGSGHGIFCRSFTVPTEWSNGLVSLWVTSWNMASFVDEGQVWLDGELVKRMGPDAYVGEKLASLKAGTTHTIAVEINAKGALAGLRGKCWISYEPAPQEKIDLAGQWIPSADGLHNDAPISLPGHFDNVQFFRRTVFLDQKLADKTGVITIDGDRALICVLVNGKLVRRHHHMIGERASLNVTRFLKFGQDNEIELVRWNGPGKGGVNELFLGFFDRNPWLGTDAEPRPLQ